MKPRELMPSESLSWYITGLTKPEGTKARLLRSIAESLRAVGDEVEVYVAGIGLRNSLRITARLFRSKADIVLVRFNWALGVSIAAIALIRRARGRRTILHVPTPIEAVVNEDSPESSRTRVRWKKLLAPFTFQVAAAGATTVIQNGEGVRNASPRLKAKTLVIANPSWEIRVGQDNQLPAQSSDALRVVGVSSSGHYHRYGRFLEGLRILDGIKGLAERIEVILIGPESAFSREQALMESTELARFSVRLTGALPEAEADQIISTALVGLGPLGAGTIRGLKSGSAHRNRTFMRLGVPFVTDLEDVAFGNQSPDWMLLVESSDKPLNVMHVLRWRRNLDLARARTEMRAILRRTSVSQFTKQVRSAALSERDGTVRRRSGRPR